jgi:2Fe-2S ferredoxin
MAVVVYIEHDGTRHAIDVPTGWTVMQGAVMNGVEGIDGACGGSCSCATCHVYVDETSLARLPRPTGEEDAMLDQAAAPVKRNSRLGCQIRVTAALNGLTVRIPETQG